MLPDLDVAEFVADVRARRVAAGRPEHITDEAVYRILDGLLADMPGPVAPPKRGRAKRSAA